MRIISKIKRRIIYHYHELIWLYIFLTGKNTGHFSQQQITIGITTFMDRYHTYFKGLLKRIRYIFPAAEIIVMVNGHVKVERHKHYLQKINKFVTRLKGVKLLSFTEPQGLSKLWNEIIKISSHDKIFLLNDDLKISPSLGKDFDSSGIGNEEIATINGSWGHFLLSKNIINLVGWFDEGLKEIGGEDDDYLVRLIFKGIDPKDFKIKTIANCSKKLKSNSFGKDMTGESRYSALNSEYLFKKWRTEFKPFTGSIFARGRYWKLND